MPSIVGASHITVVPIIQRRKKSTFFKERKRTHANSIHDSII